MFYILHACSVVMLAYWVETHYFRTSVFSAKTLLCQLPTCLTSPSLEIGDFIQLNQKYCMKIRHFIQRSTRKQIKQEIVELKLIPVAQMMRI